MIQQTVSLDMNDGTHSRHDQEHYRNCQPCLEDHLDFIQECEMDAQMDNETTDVE